MLNTMIEDAVQRLGLAVEQAPPDSRADLVLTWPNGSPIHAVVVEHTRRSTAMTPSEVQAFQIEHPGAVLALPHVTRGLAERLVGAGIDYVDAAGNAHIDRPGLLIHVEGRRPVEPPPIRRPRAPLPGPAALQVLFAVLVRPELVRAPFDRLAALSGVAKGTVHNTLTDLHDRGQLTGQRDARRLLDRESTTQMWVDGFVTTLLPSLAQQRTTGPDPDWWPAAPAVSADDITLGGGPALVHHGGRFRPDTTIVYGAPPWAPARRAGQLSTRGPHANVVLRERFWTPDLLPPSAFVPPLLAYADAVAGNDPREMQVARELRSDGLLDT